MKRIPRIKFPNRRSQSSASDSPSQAQAAIAKEDAGKDVHPWSRSRSDVPAAPLNTAVGGKASLQPKRTPVSDKEIEAIMLGGFF